ncbi:FtsQ-type POTRA domain-containing protein [Alphaproteobacteria bacterium]|nr:FtsQ-type POTRA domain-containing protein [Alphaproteobacteria bacterium]
MIFYNKVTTNYKFYKFTNMVNETLIKNGFLIENIHITGNNILTKEDILSSFQDLKNKNIFNIDLLQIQKILLLNKWIKDLEIKRILPNTIKIKITEQKAIAIWQTKSGNKLITQKGNVILVKKVNDFKNQLPIINGAEANQNTLKILKILNKNPQLYERIWSISYISKRRWDIRFKEGLKILLPKDDIEKAWLRIQHLQKKYNILELGLTEIDIRNKNQILGKVDIDKKIYLERKKLL